MQMLNIYGFSVCVGISVFETIKIKAAKETIIIAYNMEQSTF